MDQEEFTLRVLPIRNKVFRFAHSILGDHEQAQDVTQDIYERLWTRRAALETYDNIEAYIIVMTRNLCCDRLRARKVKQVAGEVLGSADSGECSLAVRLEQRDMTQIVESIIGRLPQNYRMVIHLRDVECYDIEEIASVMEFDQPTVRVYLSRARKMVKEQMIKVLNYGI